MANKKHLQKRTKLLALRVIKLTETLPKSRTADIIAKQILRSATSVGANYHAAVQAKSTANMINKLKIAEEEADETPYRLELLIESHLVAEVRLSDLMTETNEIIAMTVASLKTLRAKQKPTRHSSFVTRHS